MRVPEPFHVRSSVSPHWETTGRERLRALGQAHQYSTGTRLCAQGDHPQKVYLLDAGTVMLSFVESEGGQHVLGIRSRGSIIASSCALIAEALPFSARAASTLEVVSIDRDTFLNAISRSSAVSRYVAEVQSRELHLQIQDQADLLSLTAAQRIEDLLWRLTNDAGTTTERVRLPFSQASLARWLGVTPQYVTGVLKRLEKRGILRRSRGSFVVREPSALWHVGRHAKK